MKKNYIIGIAGGSASGKSTVAYEIAKSLGNDRSVILELDSYYKDLSCLLESEREKVNFDHPDSFDIELFIIHLNDLKEKKPIEKPQYDYASHTRKSKTEVVYPKKLIIIEGLFTFVFEELLEILDYKIYVDTADDIRILRRIKRDIKERGRAVENIMEQYLNTVRPMYKAIIEPSRKFANIIIEWNEYNLSAIKEAITQIEQSLV